MEEVTGKYNIYKNVTLYLIFVLMVSMLLGGDCRRVHLLELL